MSPAPRQRQGAIAEAKARAHLEAAGLHHVASNWRAHFHTQAGELDLIMRDGDTLVFVEVRARSRSDFGGALASIDSRKQAKLWLAARAYLAAHYGTREPPCRFDVVAIHADDVQWLPNALVGG